MIVGALSAEVSSRRCPRAKRCEDVSSHISPHDSREGFIVCPEDSYRMVKDVVARVEAKKGLISLD